MGRGRRGPGRGRAGTAALRLLLAAGLAAMVWAGAALAPMYRDNRESRALYDGLRRLAARGAASEAPGAGPSATRPPGSSVDFRGLAAINGDVVAWLSAPGAGIDYPVVRGADNAEYLGRGFDGAERAAGALFLDVRASASFGGANHAIYGHNMKDGSMFGGLKRYLDSDYALAHADMTLHLPGGDRALRPFSVYVGIESLGDVDPFDGDRAAEAHAAALGWRRRSAVDFGWEPAPGDRFVTLVTCTADAPDRRVVLHAVLSGPAPS